MRGLIGLCVVSLLVLGAVDVADATADELCASCRCVPKKIVRVVQCCFPIPEVPDLAPGAGASPAPPDVSACWQAGQFDPDACTLLCEQLNEPGTLPPNCRPMPCGPDEQLVMVEVAETVGVSAQGTGPCDSLSCPNAEAGQCNDGVNNDAWLDDLTDIEDPDCRAATPAASPYGIAALLILLAGFGAYRLRKSRAVRLS